VVDATLDEISFCSGMGSGAIREAYIAYGEVDFSRSLKDECLSGRAL
jgi:hypothetical protein